MVRILLADDHALFRQGLKTLLELEPGFHVIGEAENGRVALRSAIETKPDVVLMDIQMPVLDGVEATRAILEVTPQVRIIILTMYRQDRYVYQAVKAGAWGYLLKDATANEVVEAIRSVARGEVLLDSALADAIIDDFGLEAETQVNIPSTELSEREIALLRLLASGSTNQEIALALGISEKTVRNRLSEIFHRLHLANRTQAAIYAIREGLSGAE